MFEFRRGDLVRPCVGAAARKRLGIVIGLEFEDANLMEVKVYWWHKSGDWTETLYPNEIELVSRVKHEK